MLFALLIFWYYAPNSLAKASPAITIGIAFKVLLLLLEWVNPRHASWRLTWKEFATDLFYVGLGYTAVSYTHLDVYKRQAEKQSLQPGAPMLALRREA